MFNTQKGIHFKQWRRGVHKRPRSPNTIFPINSSGNAILFHAVTTPTVPAFCKGSQ